jgi:hypothetical protein
MELTRESSVVKRPITRVAAPVLVTSSAATPAASIWAPRLRRSGS